MKLSIPRWVLGCAMLVLAGCRQRPPPPPPFDAGPPLDGPDVIDFSDSDGDGVCDRTEVQYGTDLGLADSDGDGFSDRAELDLGYDPTRTDSPPRETLVFLDERAFASARGTVTYVTPSSTAGSSFVGMFVSIAVDDPDGIEASAFFHDAVALSADPMGDVFEIRTQEERFVGVVDRTQLVFDVSFEFDADPVRGCARAYPWRYHVKRDDGTLVAAPRNLLVIVPDGERIETAAWCVPEGRCL